RWHGRRTIEAAGQTFAIEVIARDDEPTDVYLAVDGELGIMATSEDLVRSVVERRARSETGVTSLATLPAYVAAVERLSAECLARAFGNPRAWDAALLADVRNKPPQTDEARTQQVVVDAWRATEYVVAGIALAPRLAFELAWQWKSEDLPQPLREVAAGLAGRSRFVDRIPADVWFATAGRIDLARIVRHFIADEWRHKGAEAPQNIKPETILAWALAAGLGPDFGAYCRSRGDQRHLTEVEAVVAIETQPLEAGASSPSFAETAAPLLHALLAAAVEAANAHDQTAEAEIETTTSQNLSVTAVSGLQVGARPLAFAYAVAEGVFWLGTTADAVRQAAGAVPDESLMARAELRRQLGSLIGEPTDLFYVDLSRWRSLLAAGPGAVSFLWKGQSLDAASRRQQQQTLLGLSQLADHLFAAVQIDAAGVSILVSLAAETPPREVQ
ncbi:MAG: hypothetical protein ACREJM_10105, partial [Candidatus Saccharimonadales bacterium]